MKEGHQDIKDTKELFRFKELKTYGDTEWILDNRKKYRQVFDRSETTYIYVEFSLYNKMFDAANWDLDLTLKCFQVEPRSKEICALQLNKKISKYDSIAYIREGWGNKKKASFWKEGKYQWDLYINDTFIASKVFHVIDTKSEFNVENYLTVDKIGFFEGAYDDINSKNPKKYLHSFSHSHTRYIFCHLIFRNNIPRAWVSEFFVKYYNEQGDLKTVINRLVSLGKNEKNGEVVAGFGSNTRGSWSKGRYRVEIVFMNTLIAVTHFEIDEEFAEGDVSVSLVYKDEELIKPKPRELARPLDEILYDLNRLVGLAEIKKQVREHAQYLKYLQLREKKGYSEEESINIHAVFTGNPGTGKTTVARLMGRIYFEMGFLSKGHVHEVDRVDLIGEFIGQTAPKVKEAIQKARGGILFIDEAYSLARSPEDNKDFGREAIEILNKEMSSTKGDLAVIVAGYPKEMTLFLDSNPGLRSRFMHYYEFPDYQPDELFRIAGIACEDKEVQLDDKAEVVVQDIIVQAFRNRNATFGNARFIYDLIEKAKINLGLRIMDRKNPAHLSRETISTIRLKDVLPLKQKESIHHLDLPIDYDLLKISLNELEEMVGINEVKRQVKDIVDLVKYHKMSGKNVLSSFYLHTVFIGNPGTGKTTVARILAKIYKALGILERGHLVETDRQGLIAGFIGQTAIKTSAKIDEAMGGVLFIDEAYSLSNFNGLQGDYGNEAIQTILKRMEDDRGKFFLFVAGYPENMERFLKANPGLSSRFDKTLMFYDYSMEELMQIGKQMAREKGYVFNKSGNVALRSIVSDLLLSKDKYFGNARVMRQYIIEIITAQNLRISSTAGEARDAKSLNTLTQLDVENAKLGALKKIENKRQIGF